MLNSTTTLCGVTFAEMGGIVYPLTACCKGSGKGSGNVESGVVCRACYEEVSAHYGEAALVSDRSALWSMIERVTAALSACPCPGDCADITISVLETNGRLAAR